jgi:glutaredoxin
VSLRYDGAVRCERHGLAAAPDGTCVLCRSEGRGRRSRSNAPLVALVGAVVLVGGTAFGFSLFGSRAGDHPRDGAATIAEKEAPEAPAPAPPETSPPAAPVAAAPAQPAFAAPPAGTEVVVIEAPRASVSAAPSAAPSATVAVKTPSPAEVTAPVRATPIIMFSTSWCGVCRNARAFMGQNGLNYTERDVDHDAAANAELKRLTGKTSVPAFLVDGKLVGPGFSEGSLKRAVVASVERRLGTKVDVRDK